MTVVLIRAWFENDDFRARIVLQADSTKTDRSVVVGSVEELIDVVRSAIDAIRRPKEQTQ